MERNDYDRIANQATEALAALLGSTHGPLIDSDSVTVTKDGWIKSVVAMQRTIDYCRILASAHWNALHQAPVGYRHADIQRIQCDYCNGSGEYLGATCPQCDGSGYIREILPEDD